LQAGYFYLPCYNSGCLFILKVFNQLINQLSFLVCLLIESTQAEREVQRLRKERDAAKAQVLQLSAEVHNLEGERDELRREKDDMAEQLAISQLQLKQLAQRYKDQEDIVKKLTDERQECVSTVSHQALNIDQLSNEICALKKDAEVRRTMLKLFTEEGKCTAWSLRVRYNTEY